MSLIIHVYLGFFPPQAHILGEKGNNLSPVQTSALFVSRLEVKTEWATLGEMGFHLNFCPKWNLSCSSNALFPALHVCAPSGLHLEK